MTTENLLTIAETAKLLGYTQQHVRRLVAAGELAGEKLGRDWVISRASVEDYRARIGPEGKKRGRPPKPKN